MLSPSSLLTRFIYGSVRTQCDDLSTTWLECILHTACYLSNGYPVLTYLVVRIHFHFIHLCSSTGFTSLSHNLFAQHALLTDPHHITWHPPFTSRPTTNFSFHSLRPFPVFLLHLSFNISLPRGS